MGPGSAPFLMMWRIFGGLCGHMANKSASTLGTQQRAPVVNMCDLFLPQQLTVTEVGHVDIRQKTWMIHERSSC